jgi:hypothetical protein
MRKKETVFYRKKCCLAFVLLCIMVFPAFTVELLVFPLEISSRSMIDEGEFVLSSAAAMDITLKHGYRYDILLGFSFESGNLGKSLAYGNFDPQYLPPGSVPGREDYNALVDRFNNQAILSFRIMRIRIRDIFTLPLEFSYFIGKADVFCSGDDFSSRFGIHPIGTDFKGFFYFPRGIGGNISRRYTGIHEVRGMGFSLGLNRWDFLIPLVYFYQNMPMVDASGNYEGHYSGDFRLLLNREPVKFEVFGGITLSQNAGIVYRGGLLAFFSFIPGADFLLQWGVPGQSGDGQFSIDSMYFLMEPRVDFGFLRIFLTFFYHPLYYLSVNTREERGKADVNIKFLTGNLLRYGIEGGLETTLNIKASGREEFSFGITPFISLVGGGLRWDLKIRWNPLGMNKPAESFEFFMGIRTVY